MTWHPWQGCGLESPAAGWLLYAVAWAVGLWLARWKHRLEARP